jgi:hypothetical protein
MKPPFLLLIAAIVAGGCAPGDVRIRGTFSDDATGSAIEVAAGEEPRRAEVEDGSFLLAGVPAGPVRLTIEGGEGPVAVLEIADLPRGADLVLERIRHRDGIAFPSAVRLDGAIWVTINGIRMGDPAALPGRVETDAVVLAVRHDEGALILRPAGDDLPDLPVLLGAAARVEDADGATAAASRIEPGDSVRVVGRTRDGYVLAEHILVARAPAPRRQAPAAAPAAASPGARERDRARDDDGVRRGRPPRENRGRGRGRGNDARPPGHRTHLLECPAWDPARPTVGQVPTSGC